MDYLEGSSLSCQKLVMVRARLMVEQMGDVVQRKTRRAGNCRWWKAMRGNLAVYAVNTVSTSFTF